MSSVTVDVSKWRINKKDDVGYSQYKGKLVTRFPPEPSGYLHIGHVKAIFINWAVAKRYGGHMIFRYDDTNPVNETDEYEQAILDDVLSLGVKPDVITHTSDYFQILLDWADTVVQNGNAYVDNTDAETMSYQRTNRIESKNRDVDVCTNMVLWNKMKKGEITDAVLRLKLDMKNDNAAMRDPSIYRFIDLPHLQTGTTYTVYPSYDWACPIVDSLEGVTHVFRSCEFANRDEQYDTILTLVGLKKPRLQTYGRINFQDVVMSKRKIKALVNEGKLEGWDDPRLLTIRGAKRHGLHHDALVDFIARMNFAKSTISMTQTAIWAINKKVIDKVATRYTALLRNEVVLVNINGEIPDTVEWPRFRRSPQLGTRRVYYSNKILLDRQVANTLIVGEEITLMNWGNAFVTHMDNGTVSLTSNPDGDFRKTEKKVLWLAVRSDKPLVNVVVKKYKGVDDPVVIENYVTENGVNDVVNGDYIQFLTRDYCICDDDKTFIAIPEK